MKPKGAEHQANSVFENASKKHRTVCKKNKSSKNEAKMEPKVVQKRLNNQPKA